MESNNESLSSTKFYGSYKEQLANNNIDIFCTSIESIMKNYNNNFIFCKQCKKFPFIKLCKNKKNIIFTCSCINNKKISIEELFNKVLIEDTLFNFMSDNSLNLNIGNELLCKKHSKIFKVFQNFF